MSLDYACEKFGTALRFMASSPANIKDRIHSAYLEINLVKLEDLPQDSRNEYEDLMGKLTSVTAIGDEGKLRASLDAMSEEEATELAKVIVDLHDNVIIARENLRQA